MPEIFKAGVSGADSQAMDEIRHFVMIGDIAGAGVPEPKVVAFARERLPVHSVMRALDLMERAGMIKAISVDQRTGIRRYAAPSESTE